jgi:hemolysin activation/secretion protein
MGAVAAMAVVMAIAPGAVLAEVPGPAQPGRIQQQLQPPPIPTAPPVVPQAPLRVPAAPLPVPAGEHFVLRQVIVDGSTIYSPAVLRSVYAPFLGKDVDGAGMDRIAQAITVKYRQDGYILSRAVVAAVNPGNGIVKLRVLEGYIDRVRLDPLEYQIGTKGGLLKVILQRIAHACHDSDHAVGGKPCPLNREELERYLLLANDLPGVTATAVIQPSANQTGGADLFVTITQKPVDLYVNINNRGSVYVGPILSQQAAGFNNALGLYDRTEVHVAEAFPYSNELYLVNAIEQIPLTSDGLRIAFSASHSRSRPGNILGPADLADLDDSGDIILSYPWIRTRSENLLLNADFNIRNDYTHAGDAVLFNDRSRSITIGGSYDLADRWLGVNMVALRLTQGLPILDASSSHSTLTSHFGAPPDFTKFDFELSRLQQIIPQWNILAGVSGQYAFEKLLAAEQFGYGGENYGRAYDNSEFLGDNGIAGKVELQYTPSWGPGFLGRPGLPTALQFYAYADAGRVWDVGQPGPGHESGASAGAGMRYSLTAWLSGYVEISEPLTTPVLALAAEGDNGKAPRFFFSIAAKY